MTSVEKSSSDQASFIDHILNVFKSPSASAQTTDDKPKENGWFDNKNDPDGGLNTIISKITEAGIAPFQQIGELLDKPKGSQVAGATPTQVLETIDLQGVASLIQAGKTQHIVVMVGPAVSEGSGFPNHLSPGSALYSAEEVARLGALRPLEAAFSMKEFKANPHPFYAVAKKLLALQPAPTLSHLFIALLEKKGLLQRVYTENIDGLEVKVGVPEERVVHCHGHMSAVHCVECQMPAPLADFKHAVERGQVLKCTSCSGLCKPDIVFFQERLPTTFFEAKTVDLPACDLLLMLGPSLTMQPSTSLIYGVPLNAPRVLIHPRDILSVPPPASNLMFGPSGPLMHHSDSNWRDVAYIGSTDEGVAELIALLGWQEEVEALGAAWPSDTAAASVDHLSLQASSFQLANGTLSTASTLPSPPPTPHLTAAPPIKENGSVPSPTAAWNGVHQEEAAPHASAKLVASTVDKDVALPPSLVTAVAAAVEDVAEGSDGEGELPVQAPVSRTAGAGPTKAAALPVAAAPAPAVAADWAPVAPAAPAAPPFKKAPSVRIAPAVPTAPVAPPAPVAPAAAAAPAAIPAAAAVPLVAEPSIAAAAPATAAAAPAAATYIAALAPAAEAAVAAAVAAPTQAQRQEVPTSTSAAAAAVASSASPQQKEAAQVKDVTSTLATTSAIPGIEAEFKDADDVVLARPPDVSAVFPVGERKIVRIDSHACDVDAIAEAEAEEEDWLPDATEPVPSAALPVPEASLPIPAEPVEAPAAVAAAERVVQVAAEKPASQKNNSKKHKKKK